MPHRKDKKPKIRSPSHKLKKIASTYTSFMRKNIKNRSTSPRRTRNTESMKRVVPKTIYKPLNEYQKFVRSESRKLEYRDMSGKSRMIKIAKAWKERKHIHHH
jgi:hypothetical protein